MSLPRVVIVGAGVVGGSLADELTERGWTDTTVLDAGPLPAAGGSTSHAPGVVFQTNGTKVMSDFARYTVAKFSSLTLAGQPCYLPVGGLEIATTPERAQELQRRFGFAQSWGIPGARLLDAGETAACWDLLEPSAVLGGLFVPDDGIAKGVRAVAAQLDRAAARGAVVRERTELLEVVVDRARVTGVRVRGADGAEETLPADVVVCCAGIWGPKVAGMVGQTLALTPLAHQFAWTAPVGPLAGRTSEAIRPVLRHQDASLYYREDGETVGIGSYHHRPIPVGVDDLAPWADFVGRDRPAQRSGVHPGGLRLLPGRNQAAAAVAGRCRRRNTAGRSVQRGFLLHHRQSAAPGPARFDRRVLDGRGGMGDPLRRRGQGDGRVDASTATRALSTCTPAI